MSALHPLWLAPARPEMHERWRRRLLGLLPLNWPFLLFFPEFPGRGPLLWDELKARFSSWLLPMKPVEPVEARADVDPHTGGGNNSVSRSIRLGYREEDSWNTGLGRFSSCFSSFSSEAFMTSTCGFSEVGVREEGQGGLGGLEGARTKGLSHSSGFLTRSCQTRM